MKKIRALRSFNFLQQGRVFQVYFGQEYDLPDDEAQGFLELGWVEDYENKNLGHPGENKNGRTDSNCRIYCPSRLVARALFLRYHRVHTCQRPDRTHLIPKLRTAL